MSTLKKTQKSFTYIFYLFEFWKVVRLCVRVYVCVDPRIFRSACRNVCSKTHLISSYVSRPLPTGLLHISNDWIEKVFLFKTKNHFWKRRNETFCFRL